MSPPSATPSNSAQLNEHLPLVDGLRGMAILGVVWHHLTFSIIKPHAGGALNPLFVTLPFLTNGWQGVNLFFFLSGFVLALPYLGGRRTMTTPTDIRLFYGRRAKRLLPLFYAVCLFSFVFLQNAYSKSLTLSFVATLSLLYNFVPQTFSPAVNWVFWSVGLEVWFSIFFPFILMAFVKFKPFPVALAAIMLSLSVRLLGNWVFRHSSPTLLNFISDSVLGRLDDFVLGLIACHLFLTHRAALAPFRYALITAGAGLCLTSMALWNLRLAGDLPAPFTALLANFTNLGLLALFLGLTSKRTFFTKPLSSRPLRVLGVMCYSIYAWHGLLLTKLNYAQMVARHSVVEAAVWLAVYLVCVGLFATTTFIFIEFPGNGLAVLKGLFQRNPAATYPPMEQTGRGERGAGASARS